jgi:hypothetical protein
MKGSRPGAAPNPRELPWYPEWTSRAACRGIDVNVFFNYGRNKRLINEAKRYCRVCSVIAECEETNLEVPSGIFANMTAIERWRKRGLPGYPTKTDEYRFFGQFFGKSDPSHRPLADPKKGRT